MAGGKIERDPNQPPLFIEAGAPGVWKDYTGFPISSVGPVKKPPLPVEDTNPPIGAKPLKEVAPYLSDPTVEVDSNVGWLARSNPDRD